MIHVRPMVGEDILAALALWQGLEGIGLRTADNPPALARYLRRNPGTSHVAVTDAGEVVGVGLAGHDGRRGLLHHVAVSPARQRSGLGRQLVKACLAALKAQGIEKCLLMVKPENTAGRAFWKNMGWTERGDILPMSIVTGDDPNA